MDTEKQKCCFKCQNQKPISQFYRHKAMADGHLNKCKECTKKDVMLRYYDEFAKIREYEKSRFKNQGRKNNIKQYVKKYRKLNPLKNSARQKLGRAIRSGKMVKQPCVKCGESKSEAHHYDYNKPLDVVWLCFKCHRLEHGQINVLK